MHELLQQRIDELYKASAAFAKPSQINSCECCHTESEKKTLLAIPLKSLSCDHLNDFIFSAFNTIGDADDFLYFLPRILELAFTNYQEFDCDKGLLGTKLYKSGFWERSDSLRSCVESALLAHFEHQVLQDTDWNYELNDWVCCLGNATPHIEPVLDLLIDSPYFKDYYDQEHRYAVKGKLSDAFWEKNHGNREKVISWLLSPESEARYWSFHT